MDVARRVLVSGRVQGVFYRASCAEQARADDLAGWVRNLPDGRVEAWFEGDDDAVGRLVEWCRSGPPRAAVTDLQVEDVEPSGATSFDVRE